LTPIIQVLASGLSALAGIIGSLNPQFVAAAAATALMVGPIHMLLSAIVGIPGAFMAARTAVMGFTVAMASNPIGLIAVGLASAAAAALTFAGAFGTIADQAGRAAQKIADLEALLAKMKGGGKPETKDLEAVLTPHEYTKYLDAKTDAQKKAILEEAKQNADFAAKQAGTPDQARKQAAHVGTELEELIGPRGPNRFLQNSGDKLKSATAAIKKGLIDSGVNEKDAEVRAAKILQPFVRPAAGPGMKPDIGWLSQEDINRIKKEMIAPAEIAEKKKIVIDQTIASGQLPQGAAAAPTKMDQLLGLQKTWGPAFLKEMQPARIGLEDVRATFQNQLLGKDPIEAKILELQRDEAAAMRERWAELQKRLDEITRGVK
jgi:hypothetical protein